jgi:Bifunctional DNA primase/polymerase, N-terminal
MISLQSAKTNQLIAALYALPQDWQLTPLGKKDKTGKPDPKAPYLKKWSTTDIDRQAIERDITSGRAIGFGLKLGGELVAIDFDGQSAIDYWVERFGDIPHTVTWTSGKDGRFQALFTLPPADRTEVKPKKISTGTAEQLEFRYTSHQSVLPPSPHPETDGYVWVNSPSDTSIAQLPQAAIDFWVESLAVSFEPLVIGDRIAAAKTYDLQPTTCPPIPLENCLAKSNRELLNGVSQGLRNESGAKLARDLIGSENHLRALGVGFTGDAIELFDLFASRCSPPISTGESITIWKSAERDRPQPSCKADGIANILTAWERKYSSTKPMNKTETNGTKPHGSIQLEQMPSVENVAPNAENTSPSVQNPPKENRKSVGDILLEIARTATYFHTPDKVPYADVIVKGNRHTYAVRSRAFRLWLTGEYLEREDKGVGAQTLQDTFNTLEAIAICRGETREVHLRMAEHQGKHYLDLGTSDWTAVETDAIGWRIVTNPPVRFWRPESMLPLPVPIEGGKLEELRELINVDDDSWVSICTFLLFSFMPNRTYPVLILSATRGSGKTTAAEIIKGLIDPCKAPLVKITGDTHKLAVTASKRWMMVYDNVSHISNDESDDLCRLATGFGYSTRTLHTTDEETTFEFTRPQIITAIDALANRDDLAHRVILAQLGEITENKRLPYAELQQKIEAARPRILGAMLTVISQTLAEMPHTPSKGLPRMADYGKFSIASETALGLYKGQFMEVYERSQESSRQVVIESSPVGEAIVSLMRDRQKWKGTASELLKELERHTDHATYNSRFFPKASSPFKRALNRLRPDLVSLGIIFSEIREGKIGSKFLILEKVENMPSVPSATENLRPNVSPSNKKLADGKADGKNYESPQISPEVFPPMADGIADGKKPLIVSKFPTDGTDDKADDKKPLTVSLTVSQENQSQSRFEDLTDGTDGTDGKKTTYSNYPGIGAFQVGERVTPSNPESDRWGQEGTIEVIDVDEVTASIEWDIDGDNQMAKCFRTYWISDLKLVESSTYRGT